MWVDLKYLLLWKNLYPIRKLKAGGEESLGRVYDLRPSSESHNSPTSTETETSSISISPELRSKMLSPKKPNDGSVFNGMFIN